MANNETLYEIFIRTKLNNFYSNSSILTCDAPEKRPSVIKATSLPRPAPMIAAVGFTVENSQLSLIRGYIAYLNQNLHIYFKKYKLVNR